MTPELSRRIGEILGSRPVDKDVRYRILDAAETAETQQDLPPDIRALLDDLAKQPTYADLNNMS